MLGHIVSLMTCHKGSVVRQWQWQLQQRRRCQGPNETSISAQHHGWRRWKGGVVDDPTLDRGRAAWRGSGLAMATSIDRRGTVVDVRRWSAGQMKANLHPCALRRRREGRERKADGCRRGAACEAVVGGAGVGDDRLSVDTAKLRGHGRVVAAGAGAWREGRAARGVDGRIMVHRRVCFIDRRVSCRYTLPGRACAIGRRRDSTGGRAAATSRMHETSPRVGVLVRPF